MNWKNDLKPLLYIIGGFILFYFLPVENAVFTGAVNEALALAKWYVREHVLLCLVPAFFIAGTIAVFIGQGAVIKYLGSAARKWLAYLIASVSGSVLAVCSCTILPLFSSIYKRGAGIGPATAFLYSGPAVNILAMILTARILGFELGVARVIGAVVFSVVIGLIMHLIYRREEAERAAAQVHIPDSDSSHPLWQTVLHFVILVAILVFATWGRPAEAAGAWQAIWSVKWILVSVFGLGLSISLVMLLKVNWYWVIGAVAVVAASPMIFPLNPLVPFITAIILLIVLLSKSGDEAGEWLDSSWGFARQILPLLAAGVLAAGFFLGSPEGGQGIIPASWVESLVGGNSLSANFFASIVGAFMYFATLTEIPILQGLVASGMGKGPALALLLAGPALSLPNMLVIRSVMGTQKTIIFVSLVVVMATLSGILFGTLY